MFLDFLFQLKNFVFPKQKKLYLNQFFIKENKFIKKLENWYIKSKNV